jgi:uncharacterized protein with HEPN domain
VSPRPWRDRLRDILECIEEILEFTAGMTEETFEADAKTCKAVLADFAILGEAAAHLPTEVIETYPDVPWASMRGMRNLVVHAYFHVEATIVWQTVREDLPALATRIRRVLDADATM